MRTRDHQHAVHSPRPHQRHRPPLPVRLLVGVERQHQEFFLPGGILRPADQLREKRIDDVRNDHAQRVRALLAQALSDQVGMIIQILHRRQHPQPRPFADTCDSGKHVGDRGGRYPGTLSNLFEVGHPQAL